MERAYNFTRAKENEMKNMRQNEIREITEYSKHVDQMFNDLRCQNDRKNNEEKNRV